ncbi:hypothetical protein F183_A34940 [Bryobacterales bacterium F-183]|nr:hypothetical protein F183_A34940 [Bryobacterales bacterium F-183]
MYTSLRLGRVARLALQASAAFCLMQQVMKADLYGVDAVRDKLYRLNPTTGAATEIGSTALSGLTAPGGLAWNGSTMLVLDLDGGDLFTLDLATGVPTFVSAIGSVGWQALASRPSDGALFLTNNGNFLFSLNQATGVVTEIGAHNVGLITALDFDATGELWGVDFFTGRYGTFNTSTGQFTEKGITRAGLQGLAFGEAGTVYVSSTQNQNLYTLDLATGQTTLVGPTGTVFMKAIEFVPNATSAVPEPVQTALLSVGLLAAATLGRIRRTHTN